MRRDGVRVLSPRGDFTARPHATDDPASVGPLDYVFRGLQANSSAASGPLVHPLLHERTAVVAAQNGIPWWYFHGLPGPYTGRRIEAVDPGGTVSATLPPERAVGCVVYAATELESPGVVRHLGRARARRPSRHHRIRRSFDARISTEHDAPLTDSACVYRGNCIEVCPTGALSFTSEFDMRAAGTWDESAQSQTTTVCAYCGVGCNPTLHVQENEIVKVTSPHDNPVTHGNLCIKGRFGYQHVQNRM